MKSICPLFLVLLIFVTCADVAQAQTATPTACAFQIDCNYPTAMPFPTLALPTSVVPTPTFLAPGSLLPPFPAIYPQGTAPQGNLKLVLDSTHILEFAWEMALYGVQAWNYYYNGMSSGPRQIIDGIQGIFLFILLIAFMNNIFTKVAVPRINDAGRSVRHDLHQRVETTRQRLTEDPPIDI